MASCDVPGLMPIEEALIKILAPVKPVTTVETLPLPDAINRVVAEDICSPINVPPFANSAMNGYAVNTADLSQSLTLPMAGKSFAGQPFKGKPPHGSCIRIMTGAEVPVGCDAIIMQELATADGDQITFESIPAVGNHIRPIGDDITTGSVVIKAGTRLTAREMPLLASLGVATIPVFARPKVAFFSTGDELRPLGETLEKGQIFDSNRYGIHALLTKFGCDVIDLGIIPDIPEKLSEAFTKADQQADVVITSGGVSVGEADFTKDILEQNGHIDFWKIAMKPGKPFAYGTLDNSIFCGLPGNPVSAMLTLYQLVQPLLAKLSGHTDWQPPLRIQAKANTIFKKRPGRTDFQRGIYTINTEGQFEVSSCDNQGSGAFSSMHHANCFVVLEKDRGFVNQDETVTIELFNSTLY